MLVAAWSWRRWRSACARGGHGVVSGHWNRSVLEGLLSVVSGFGGKVLWSRGRGGGLVGGRMSVATAGRALGRVVNFRGLEE